MLSICLTGGVADTRLPMDVMDTGSILTLFFFFKLRLFLNLFLMNTYIYGISDTRAENSENYRPTILLHIPGFDISYLLMVSSVRHAICLHQEMTRTRI